MRLRGLLSELRRHRGDARLLVDELREELTREAPDESTRRDLAAELARRGISLGGLEAVWKPGIGEGYVLLVGATGGSVGRLTVRRAGNPFRLEGELGGGALSQAMLAIEVLGRRLAARGRGVPEVDKRGHEVVIAREVDGSSLGMAFAAAAVSRWSGRAPSAEVAATAALDLKGGLVPVNGLEAKVTALVEAYPAVRRVVIAPNQAPNDAAIAGVALVRCATVDEALREFGLALDDVRGGLPGTSEAEAQIAQLEFVQEPSYSAARWREHAMRARMLAGHPRISEYLVAKASAFAALFHLHAGDSELASELARAFAEDAIAGLPASAQVWVRIVQSTSCIDSGRHDDAIRYGDLAVEGARRLSTGEQRDLLGRALGTRGRAAMHAGDDEAALPWLRDAAAHHAEQLPREAARSFTTLGIACRRAGRYGEALEALDNAARSIEENQDEQESASARLFLSYERGRVLFELGELEQAYEHFEAVVLGQLKEEDYPRVGCLRYLAAIDAACGRAPRAAEWLGQALGIAERCPPLIGRIAASAAMAVLGPHRLEMPRAAVLFEQHFSEPLDPSSVQRGLRTLVY